MLYMFYPFLPVYDIWYVLLIPFALIGIYRAFYTRAVDQWLLMSMFMYAPVGFVFVFVTRYRHSMMPAFITISSLGLIYWHDKHNRTRWYLPVMSAWVSLNILVLCFSTQIRGFLKYHLL